MRRLGALMAVVTALALAACSSPRAAGTDGDLVDDWPAMAAAQLPPPPEAGSCQAYASGTVEYWLTSKFTLVQNLGTRKTLDCTTDDGTSNTAHDTETAYVSSFTGADATAATPPAEGSAGRRAAYTLCENKVDEYLGGDWHSASVWVLLVLPDDAAWRGGARWFACDIGHMENPITTVMIKRGAVRNGLSGARPLAVTCIATQEDASQIVQRANLVDCGQPHAAEYAGYYTAPDRTWSDSIATNDESEDGCGAVVAHYLGLPSIESWTNQSLGYWSTRYDKERWEMGDRTVRCFAYAFTKSKVIIGSVKGIKNATPKS